VFARLRVSAPPFNELLQELKICFSGPVIFEIMLFLVFAVKFNDLEFLCPWKARSPPLPNAAPALPPLFILLDWAEFSKLHSEYTLPTFLAYTFVRFEHD